MQTRAGSSPIDIAILGTFAAWRLGTLQARALPFARQLRGHGIRCAIITVPWDMPTESGVCDQIGGVPLINTRSTGVRSFPFAVAQQLRLINQLAPRAVHVFKPKGYGGLAGWCMRHRVPLIVDSDDWEGDGGWNQAGHYSLPQRRLFDWQERTLLRGAEAVTAASHLLARRASSLRGSPDQVTWVPNGLDAAWADRLAVARSTRRERSTDPPTILLYSRFAEFPDDWLPRFLTSLSAGLGTLSAARVVVVGATHRLGMRYSNLDLNLLGYVARELIPNLLGAADIAVYPYGDSLVSRSKNSVKLLELMQAGCAVVATDAGDISAVGGDAIVRIASSDPDAFASAAIDLVQDRDRRARLQSTAQRRAGDQFSIAATTERLVSAYQHVGLVAT